MRKVPFFTCSCDCGSFVSPWWPSKTQTCNIQYTIVSFTMWDELAHRRNIRGTTSESGCFDPQHAKQRRPADSFANKHMLTGNNSKAFLQEAESRSASRSRKAVSRVFTNTVNKSDVKWESKQTNKQFPSVFSRISVVKRSLKGFWCVSKSCQKGKQPLSPTEEA